MNKRFEQMTEDELIDEENELYEDCVFFNDCGICPHKLDDETYHCRLALIVDYRRNRKVNYETKNRK